MNNQKVKLTNKLVNGFKSNTFTADGKKGKPYFIQEETAPGLNLRVQPTWKDKQGNEFQGTKTIREYEYTCVVGENEFNGTMNITATKERSGSISVTGVDAWKLFPPGHATAKSGSFNNSYTAADSYENFVTHSEFRPYVTKVGLYNDFNQLIAIGQLSAPIKNEKDLSLGIVVRFDS